jgi:hypothetical protein
MSPSTPGGALLRHRERRLSCSRPRHRRARGPRRPLAARELLDGKGPSWLVVVALAGLVLGHCSPAASGTAEACRALCAPRVLLGTPSLGGRSALEVRSVRRGCQAELRPEMADRIRVALPTDSEQDDVRGDASGRCGRDEKNGKRPPDRAGYVGPHARRRAPPRRAPDAPHRSRGPDSREARRVAVRLRVGTAR